MLQKNKIIKTQDFLNIVNLQYLKLKDAYVSQAIKDL